MCTGKRESSHLTLDATPGKSQCEKQLVLPSTDDPEKLHLHTHIFRHKEREFLDAFHTIHVFGNTYNGACHRPVTFLCILCITEAL